jgi:threonine dehydrogenase-like Zn-dependent dehydrogenase
MGAVAISALRKADLAAGDKVLVMGQGIVGNLAAQFLMVGGADVMAADLVEERLRVARASGVPKTVNPAVTPLEGELETWTGGAGPRIVVEATGQPELVPLAVRVVAAHGQVLLLGTPRKKTTLEVSEMLFHIHTRDLTLGGAYLLSVPTHPQWPARHSIESNAKQILDWIREGRVKTETLMTHTVRPDDCQRAFEALERDKAHYQALLFDWEGMS